MCTAVTRIMWVQFPPITPNYCPVVQQSEYSALTRVMLVQIQPGLPIDITIIFVVNFIYEYE